MDTKTKTRASHEIVSDESLVILQITRELDELAVAFQITGNAHVSKRLFDISDSLNMAKDNISKAFHDEMSRSCNFASQLTGTILTSLVDRGEKG
jgi:hypothetical protein